MSQNASPKGPIKPRAKNKRRSQQTEAKSAEGNRILAVAIWPAVAALIGFYAWGWYGAAPSLIIVLGAITATSETIKTQLGGLAEAAFKQNKPARGAAYCVASVACIAWGVTSGVVALNTLEAPHKAFEAAQDNASKADASVTGLKTKLANLPQATEKMPAARIKEMEAANASAAARLAPLIEDAESQATSARAAAAKIKNPGPGLPSVPEWAKALIVLFVEYLVFVVPWANSAPRSNVVTTEQEQPKPAAKADPLPPKVNTGGWEKRRLRYGASGRRQALRLVTA